MTPLYLRLGQLANIRAWIAIDAHAPLDNGDHLLLHTLSIKGFGGESAKSPSGTETHRRRRSGAAVMPRPNLRFDPSVISRIFRLEGARLKAYTVPALQEPAQ